jgi:hypothetical protein
MLGRIVSTAISNPWLKPLTENVRNVVVGLLNFWLAGDLWKTLGLIDKCS